MEEKRKVYFINELEKAEDGGYIPCIAIEGEAGYHKTNWNWGRDLAVAEQFASAKNNAMGISDKDASIIVICTMVNQKALEDN